MRIHASQLLLALALPSAALYGSKEGILSLSEFSVQSEGIGSSGPIKVTGKQNYYGLQGLQVNAFGKVFTATTEQLALIGKLPFNGVQLSFEAGYKEVGGKTLYITFTFGFTSGVKKVQTIEVQELKGFNIEGKVPISQTYP